MIWQQAPERKGCTELGDSIVPLSTSTRPIQSSLLPKSSLLPSVLLVHTILITLTVYRPFCSSNRVDITY